jgi:hypothetical protein
VFTVTSLTGLFPPSKKRDWQGFPLELLESNIGARMHAIENDIYLYTIMTHVSVNHHMTYKTGGKEVELKIAANYTKAF